MSEAGGIISRQENLLPDVKIQTGPLKWWRRLTQTVGLLVLGQWSFYGIFRCPFLVPYVSCQNCPVITCHGRIFTMFWGFWLLIPLSALFFGRAFCGWFCPGGLINQLLGRVAPVTLSVKNRLTGLIPYFKYLGLAIALYVWLGWGQPREAIPIRVGGFFSSVLLTFEHGNLIWIIRTFFVLGFLAAGILIASAWCRFACPLGGVLSILGLFSLFKVYKNEKCNECNKCLKICEVGTRPGESNCNNCSDCLSVCSEDAIKIGRFRR